MRKQPARHVELVPLSPGFGRGSKYLRQDLVRQFKGKSIQPRELIESLGYSFLVSKVSGRGSQVLPSPDLEITFKMHGA